MSFQSPPSREESEAVVPRKRRARSQLPFLGYEERDAALDALAQRAFPSVVFFAGTALAAAIMAVSVWLQSLPLMVASVLIAPSLAPLAGAALGVATASPRFAMRNLLAILISAVLACGGALCVRWIAGEAILGDTFHIAMDIPSLLVVVVSGIVLTICIIRSPEVVRLASAGIWFVLLSGITVAMWNATTGRWDRSEEALVITGGFLLLGILISAATFLVMGFRPPIRNVLAFSGMIGLVAAMGAVMAVWVSIGKPSTVAAAPSPTSTWTPTMTSSPKPTVLPSQTPLLTATGMPSPTPTETFTPTPKPVPAVIRGTGGKGANLRDMPGGKLMRSLLDGDKVEVLGSPVEDSGMQWLKVRTADGTVGWIFMDLCATIMPTVAP